ncbi:MAG: hypothetical protein PWQ77_1687 [Kosmotogales bacterium]|nr:hypothetical protein [Kosmotogales bacterium]
MKIRKMFFHTSPKRLPNKRELLLTHIRMVIVNHPFFIFYKLRIFVLTGPESFKLNVNGFNPK